MIDSNRKFFVELILLTVLIFLIFISATYENLIFDLDGIRMFSIVCFAMSVDLCLYAYKNILNQKTK